VAAVITALALVLTWLGADRLDRQLTLSFESKGEAIALAMATSAEQNLSGDIALVQGAVDANKIIFAVKYIFVIDDHGRPYVHTFAPSFPKELEQVNRIALGDVFEASHRVKVARDVVYREGGREMRAIDVAAPVAAGALGSVHVGMDTNLIAAEKMQLWWSMLGLGLVVAAVGVLVCFGLMHVLVIRPVRALTEVTSRIVAEGDLAQTIAATSDDELGDLGVAFSSMVEKLRSVISTVRTLVDGVAEVSRGLAATGTVVASGGSTVLVRVRETSASMRQNFASLQGIGEHAIALNDSAARASVTISQMVATNERVASGFEAMAVSATSVGTAVEQLASSTRGVAQLVERLQASIRETGAATREMDAATGRIEENADRTSALSELVGRNAEKGVEALEVTVRGIQRIHEASKVARSVIESLGARVGEIGTILDVIGDVAEQTNLLALNASIIASQAGEQGAGFAIVADRVKELAQRTSTSTVEIGQLIHDVQTKTNDAVNAITLGSDSVQEGVRLGDEAAAALRRILESATQATAMAKGIAAATAAQNRGSKDISASIERVTADVGQIAAASNDQAARGTEIAQSATTMRSLTEQARRSSVEQAVASKNIIKSIAQINEMAALVSRAQKEQAGRTAPVLAALETIRETSQLQNGSMADLERVIAALNQQAEILREALERFRL
jgi:methyl-accepting chemotaxis protein